MRVAVGFCFSLLAACNRTEEPHALEDAHVAAQPLTPPAAAEKSKPSAKPSEHPPATACVVPTAAEPPRRAANALHCPPDPEQAAELAHGYVLFTDAPGSPRLNVELARSEAEKERGL